MNISNMPGIFKIAHESEAAVKMVGRHGIGKTQIVKQFGKEYNFHVEVLQLPLMEEGDLMGIPVTEERHGAKITTWAKPVWVQRIDQATEKGIPSIIFLDELGRASTAIRQIALQMVLENKLQEHSLGVVNGLQTLFVVADNPSDEYDTEDFDPALESRFMTFNVEASVNDWLKYARSKEVLPVITDYLAEFPEKLHFQTESDDDKGTDPRSWEKLSDILKNTPEGFKHLNAIITSKLGRTVGANFMHFFNNYVKIVKPQDIMKELKDMPLETEKEQRAAAKKLEKITQGMEVLSQKELANKMLNEHFKNKDKVTVGAIIAYVASLNKETTASVLKDWKESDNKKEHDFYFGPFNETTPNRWLLQELLAVVLEK